MDILLKKELSDYLAGFVSESRLQRFSAVLQHRTTHLRVVLENVYQEHNASAVLRSCDCFGVQHVHFIENKNRLRISDEVSMGSHKWLNVHRHNSNDHNTVTALRELKAKGYRIVATTPHKDDCTIDALPVDQKLALVFGTELEGITPAVYEEADAFVKIPMYGFTESFNISVCAALCLYELTTRIRKTVPHYRLSEEEKTETYFNWLKTSVEKSEALISDYLQKRKAH